MFWLPANRGEKQLNLFLEEQLTGLVTAVAETLSHDTVVGCARRKTG
jgi:hypothetical protein